MCPPGGDCSAEMLVLSRCPFPQEVSNRLVWALLVNFLTSPMALGIVWRDKNTARPGYIQELTTDDVFLIVNRQFLKYWVSPSILVSRTPAIISMAVCGGAPLRMTAVIATVIASGSSSPG